MMLRRAMIGMGTSLDSKPGGMIVYNSYGYTVYDEKGQIRVRFGVDPQKRSIDDLFL